MDFFQHHVFICCNQRPEGEGCCNNLGASQMLDYMKDRVKALGLAGQGKVRINRAGCLGRCDDGPVIVIYPQGTWYTYLDQEDIDEIVDEHLINGRVVERLML